MKCPADDSAGQKHLLGRLIAVLEAYTAVEHEMLSAAVLRVGAEVTQTHELVGSGGLGVLQALFYLTAGEHFQRIGIQVYSSVPRTIF